MTHNARTELLRVAGAAGPGSADAKVALGDGPVRERLAAAIRALAVHRGPASSTCPSDAARAVGGEQWRELLELTRQVASSLAVSGAVEVTQRGAVLDPGGRWHGPVRIRVVS